MRLQRKAPTRTIHHKLDGRLQRFFTRVAVHRLDEEIAEIPAFELRRLDPRLGPDELELISAALNDIGACLGTDAQPVDPLSRGQRAIALDSDTERSLVQGLDEGLVELEHGLSPGDDHQSFAPLAPRLQHVVGERARIGELSAAFPIRANKIGVAETALSCCSILFAPGPPREEYFTKLAEIRSAGRKLTEQDWIEVWARHDQYPA